MLPKAADPKPRKRVRNAKAGLGKVKREGACRACNGRCCLTRFHLVGRDLGGDDVDSNLIPVCLHCHDNWETHAPGWEKTAAKLRAGLRPEELSYVTARAGGAYLERYFPA